MRLYYVDIMNMDDIHGHVVEIKAQNAVEAFEKATHKYDHDTEYIYQIRRDVKGCELAQPVYDYFNGFSLKTYKELDNE